MTGHVALYRPNEEPVWFTVTDPMTVGMGSANAMAAQIRSGAGDMNDYQDFAYWVQDGWRSGFGRDPYEQPGGYKWGMIDSRFEGRITPPPNIGPVADERLVLDIGDHNIRFTAAAANKVALYASCALSFDAQIKTTAGVALSPVLSGSRLLESLGEDYYVVDYGAGICTVGVEYFLTLTVTESTNICVPVSPDNNALIDGTGKYAYVKTFSGSLGEIVDSTDANGFYYAASADGKIYKRVGSTFTDLGLTLDDIIEIQAYGNRMIVAHGADADLSIVNLDTLAVTTATGIKGTSMALWGRGNYLWVGHESTVNYTADLSTWTAITVTPPGEDIIEVSGLADRVLISSGYALWAIAPGNIVEALNRWSGRSDSNGRNMINWQGNAYLSEGTVLYQYGAASGMQPIFSRGEETPYGLSGEISSISTSNRDLMIAINGPDGGSVMSFTNEGWAVLLTFAGQTISNIGYSAEDAVSFVFMDDGSVVQYDPATRTSNPDSDPSYMFSPSGWIRTGLYTGGLRTVSKDWHSVTIAGENLNDDNFVRVYYRSGTVISEEITDEELSAIEDESGDPLLSERLEWVQLGDITQTGQELIIDDYAARPVGPTIEFGFVLMCTGREDAPSVTDISVKSHPMIDETYRWSVPILAADYQEMVDGTRDTRTGEEIEDKIIELDKWKRPLYFRDLRGKDLVVKIQNVQSRTIKYEWINGAPSVHNVVQVTLTELSES